MMQACRTFSRQWITSASEPRCGGEVIASQVQKQHQLKGFVELQVMADPRSRIANTERPVWISHPTFRINR
jgi:hypothetical protein